MPPQIKSSFNQVRLPFERMSYTPDVPSAALAANEYNQGQNIQTDVRGIRSVAGDQRLFAAMPSAPVFVTAGFRRGEEYWIVVALATGQWYATNGTKYQYQALPAAEEFWYDITPPGLFVTGYAQNQNITVEWNGSVLFVNDSQNPPFVWFDELGTVAIPQQQMLAYSNQVPIGIDTIAPVTTSSKIVAFDTAQAAAPFDVGSTVVITDASPQNYNGRYTVLACTTTDVTIDCDVTDAYYSGGTISPLYSWNYNPDWATVTANFMRMFVTPNVGSILVAGNLIAGVSGGAFEHYPTTVQWSQSFGLNSAPLTWTPTVTNVANQLEIPLRGPAMDGYSAAGQFFISSYWDTVVLSPLNYTTTNAPILGVKLFAKDRGLLSTNSWCEVDGRVYGVDARDIWVFDGQQFNSIGNQRIKNWFYDQLLPEFYDRVFMVNNSRKQQIEIYYSDADSLLPNNPGAFNDGVPNKMISYRYDIDCWNPPKDTASATYACQSPIWSADTVVTENVLGFNVTNPAAMPGLFTVTYRGGTYIGVVHEPGTGAMNQPGDVIAISGADITGGVAGVNDLEFTVIAVDGLGEITSVDTSGLYQFRSPGSWQPQLSTRTVIYASVGASLLPNYADWIVERDRGYTLIDKDLGTSTPIASVFRRDNIRLTKDYTNSVMIHRLLPEAVNIGSEPFTAQDNIEIIPSLGSIDIKVSGAASVGSSALNTVAITVPLDTDQPWAQINQNAYRVNSIEISDSSSTDSWYLNAINCQYTVVEDDR